MGTQITLEFPLSERRWAELVGRKQLFALQPGPRIHRIRELQEEEWEDYTFAFALLVAADMARKLLGAAAENFDELAQALDGFAQASAQPDAEGVRDDYEHLINRRLSNYLSSMRLFLDHAEYRLKRVYGDNSDPVLELKATCSRLYDELFAYRFAYKLRNYTQHFGLPVWDVTSSSRVTLGAADRVQYFGTVAFSIPSLLLVGQDVWGPLRKELEQMPERLDVAEALEELPSALDQVWLAFLKGQQEYLDGARRVVQETLAVESPPSGTVVAGEWVADGDLLALSWDGPPVDILQWLEAELRRAAG